MTISNLFPAVICIEGDFNVLDESFVCCSEVQFRFQCRFCYEVQGCGFCEFNPYDSCECRLDTDFNAISEEN